MRRWELTLELDPRREQPLFLQLAQAIGEAIRQRRLRPGDALPGTRELAALLHVTRNTVVAGYGELAAEGLVRTRVGGGTFVVGDAAAWPDPGVAAGIAAGASSAASPAGAGVSGSTASTSRLASRHVVPAMESAPTYDLPAATVALRPVAPSLPPGALLLSHGLPDARLLPARALARAFGRAIGRQGRSLLTYADPCGHVRLRRELATMLARTRGLAVGADDLLVTRSIEQAIDLVARALIRPGDVVAVEAFGYPPAWQSLTLAGARLVPLPVDADGLDIDALAALAARERLRAVFVTPHHQFPTATVMSPARRARLGQLAVTHRFAVLEDDYDHECHYDGKPVLPLAAGPYRANVIYIGSLANLLAPAASTGFVIAPAPLRERLAALRAGSDPRGDAGVDCAIAELFEDGELLRHARRLRRVYASRRDVLAEALRRHLSGVLSFHVAPGGMALWTDVDAGVDVPAWIAAAGAEGVALLDARRFHFAQRDGSHLRLGFTYHDEDELREAVTRLARALQRLRSSRAA